MARDSAKRAASREADRLRKRAKREVGRLERLKTTQSSSKLREAYDARIDELNDMIARSKVNRKNPNEAEQRKAVRELSSLTGAARGKASADRQNAIFETDIAIASRGGMVVGSEQLTPEKVKLFYRATQPIWDKLSPEDRNKAIMDRLGVNKLKDAYKIVMAYEKRAYDQLMEQYEDIEEYGIAEGGEAGETERSPLYLASVEMIY